MKDILPICQEDFLSGWSAFLSSLDHLSNLVTVALTCAVCGEVMINHEGQRNKNLGLDDLLQKF